MAAPTCTTEAPTLIGQDFVTLNGVLVTTGGKPCTVRFWYKREDSPHWTTSPWGTGGADGSPFELTLTNQHPHGAYIYVAEVANADGSDYGLIIRWWYRWKIAGYDGSPFFAHGYQAIGPYQTWTITLDTDICCHLTMHVDNNVPYRRKGEHFKRGIVYMHTPLTYFTPKWELDQQEPGDTTAHTFLWTCKKPYGRYTFQATGTVDGRLSPSKTPFYYIRCKPVPPPVETNDQCLTANANLGYCQYGNANGGTFRPDHDYNLAGLSLRLNQFADDRDGWVKIEVRRVGGDCWSEPIIAEDGIWARNAPPPGSQAWTYFNMGGVPLTAGTNYRIVVYGTEPWYVWYNGKWVLMNNMIAMMLWVATNPNCYTRGNYCYGCNLKFHRGPWINSTNDLNFICWAAP